MNIWLLEVLTVSKENYPNRQFRMSWHLWCKPLCDILLCIQFEHYFWNIHQLSSVPNACSDEAWPNVICPYFFQLYWHRSYIFMHFVMQPGHICQYYFYHITVGCGRPIISENSSIDLCQNTTEGAEMFFRCNPGFVPAGRMRAVCGADQRWMPDPAALMCRGEIALYLGSHNFLHAVYGDRWWSCTMIQWRNYTQAYPGLCPQKIHWCLGKNNVESQGQRPVIGMCDHFHVDVKRACR